MKLTEIEIIEGCKKGLAAYQKALFSRYSSLLFGVCQRYARNTADAEDMLQDAFIKIFSKIDQFKSAGSFEGWMRRIVVNTALKKYSLTRYSKEISVESYAENGMIAEAPAFAHLTEKDLLALITRLPDGYRLIFNLYVIEGYSHDEIADILGIQAGTSRSQLVKARGLLQKQLFELHKLAV
jgi:RNA polymerase sigma-70 factor (ECF subfamily)